MISLEGSYGTSNDDAMTGNRRIVEVADGEQSAATIHISVDARRDLGSIVGYAKEPLLSLAEACIPLVGIIYNILSYVQVAISNAPKQPRDGLTVDQSAAIRLYTMEWKRPHRSLYSMLNHTLNTGNLEDLQPYFKYLKLFLTALAKLPCAPPQAIWRGVPRNISADFPSGTIVTWWSFSSCTTSMDVLNNSIYLGNTGPRTLFSIETINGRIIRNHSHYPRENEILLLPGTRMIVQPRLNPAADLHIIHLKQIIPEETLLELPFKGNSYSDYFQSII